MDRIVRTVEDCQHVLKRVRIKRTIDWDFQVHAKALPGTDAFIIYADFGRWDAVTGEYGRGSGRDFILYPGVNETGVLKTAYMAVKQLVEHELMHSFTVDGAALFDPHAPASNLLAISGKADTDAYDHWGRGPKVASEEAFRKIEHRRSLFQFDSNGDLKPAA